MSDWREQLAEAFADEKTGWEGALVTVPEKGEINRVQIKSVEIEIVLIREVAVSLLGRCNRDPIGLIPSGRVLVSGYRTKPVWDADGRLPDRQWVTFTYHTRSWNEFLSPYGQWQELHDSRGIMPFPPADFSVIP